MTLAASEAPTVSLIVCTRNRAAQLSSMLDSLEALDSRRLLEVLFVDNGSSDGTAAVLAAYRQRSRLPVRIVTEPRPGLSNARNAGIRAARGALIAFTDDDCYPAVDFIEVMAGIFAAHHVDIVGGPLILHDPSDHWVSTHRAPVAQRMAAGSMIEPSVISGGCMAFRREVFESAGLFDPELGAGTQFPIEDAEMVSRACLIGHPAGFFIEPVVRHHHRRKRKEGEALVRRFAHGRGAFWAKMLLRFPRHRGIVLRHWYWMLRSGVLGSPVSGVLEALREFAGAIHYLMRRRPRDLPRSNVGPSPLDLQPGSPRAPS